MMKSEIKEAIAERDYWYDNTMMHRTDDGVNYEREICSYSRHPYERYDRPIGCFHCDYDDSSMCNYLKDIKTLELKNIYG